MFQEPLDDIQKQGEDQALGLLSHLVSFESVDIYKSVCSIKCAEILTRAFDTPAYRGVVEIVATFISAIMKAVDGNDGSKANGMAILQIIETIAPFKSYPGAEAFAVRMHMFDTMILASAKKLGIEAQAKEAVDNMQRDIFVFLLQETAVSGGSTEIN